jgi:hypothetical protein
MTESEHEHTTALLAAALDAIPGVPPDMIERARTGHYHDYLSPLDFPAVTLAADLKELASRPATPRNSRPLLRELAQRVMNGDFDATTAESDAWAQSAEGRETLAALTGQPGTGDAPDGDAVKACADLAGRTGARSFECGYLHDDVPADRAGWYATAVYKGTKITAEDRASPAEACRKLAVQLLSGAQCQHCGKLVTLNPLGAMARDVTLINGTVWTAAEQAQAGLCHWRLDGARWERGCA